MEPPVRLEARLPRPHLRVGRDADGGQRLHGRREDLDDPGLILFAWKRIQAYPCGKAPLWRFPSLEAIVSPDTRPSTATWPHAWPTVAHERPSGDEAFENVIDLPAKAYDQLRSMARGSVQIGAQNYFVHAHVPWPQESLWSGRPPHACGPEPRHD